MSICLTNRRGRMYDQEVELTREEIRSDAIYLVLYKECQRKHHNPKVKPFLEWMEAAT